MALFSRTSVDDPALAGKVGRRRVLAAGRGRQGQVLGLADALVWADAAGAHELAWHEVERGGWDGAARTLRWRPLDGAEVAVELTEAGLLPDLFNERVTASIACVRRVDLAGSGTATVTARRNLGDPDAALVWRVAAGPGTTPAEVATDPVVARELSRLRAEYDLG